jgi:hypothetical protein
MTLSNWICNNKVDAKISYTANYAQKARDEILLEANSKEGLFFLMSEDTKSME